MNYYQDYFHTFYPERQQTQPMEAMMPHMDLVHTLHKCAAHCFHTLSEIIKRPDANRRSRQIQLLHDCARMCESQAAYTVMDSPIAKQHAQMCAFVCEECGRECAKYNDQMSQQCSKICLECAAACRQYAGM